MKASFITSSVFGLVSLAISSVYASPIAINPEAGSKGAEVERRVYVTGATSSNTTEVEKRQGAFWGDATYYETGTGACGWWNGDYEWVVAIAHGYFDNYPGANGNPNDNPICGRGITAQYQGKQVTLGVVDRCAGCAGYYDLDLSPSAFSQLADQSVGRLTGVEWWFN